MNLVLLKTRKGGEKEVSKPDQLLANVERYSYISDNRAFKKSSEDKAKLT